MSVRVDDHIRAQCYHPSGRFVEFTNDDVKQSIPERFQAIVQMYPDRLAVKTKNHALTYDEINKAANRVARAILAQRPNEPEPIALLFSEDIQAIVAILGVLKTGKFYVPMDPSLPLQRSESIIRNSGTNMLLCDRINLSTAHKLATNRLSVIDIDECDANFDHENPSISLAPESVACILYTSGSTGEPKGVVQNHRNLLHWTKVHTNNLRICSDDRLTWLQRYTVASSLHNLFGSLLNGAALYPFDPRVGGLELARWLMNEEVTVYHSVVMVLRQLVDDLTGKEEFPNLRVIRLSGMAITPKDVELYKKHFSSQCILVHVMGVTEAGTVPHFFIDKTTHVTEMGVPVGYAAEGAEINLIDDNGNKVGAGQVGEITIKSRYLAPGYWQQPELTNEKFISDPSGGKERIYLTGDVGRLSADGCLIHLGRKDFQANVRGFRVETGEVEKILLNHPAISEAVVSVQQDDFGDSRLVAYFVPTKKPEPTVSDLQSYLNSKLPSFMIPTSFVTLDSFPRLPSGKIDRKALPRPSNTRPKLDTPFVRPRFASERELAKIWAEVLSLNHVGIHDNFLALGGNSLAATRIVSLVIKHFQLEIPLETLFQSPTVAEMAVVISEQREKKLDEKSLENILNELESLSDDEAQRLVSKS